MVRDETMAGRVLESWLLPGVPLDVTARELLRSRVREEFARRRASALAVAGDDWESQADEACRSFDRNGFVMLVGDRQVEDLDELLDLRESPVVAFVRLVPLVGG